MCDYNKPRRVRNDTRMILHVEGADGQRFREWCAYNGTRPRVGLGQALDDLARYRDEAHSLRDKLSASEDARRLAERVAFDHAGELGKAEGERDALRRKLAATERECHSLHSIRIWWGVGGGLLGAFLTASAIAYTMGA
jgi:hypothetical protein